MREFLLCSVICLAANLFAARQITVTQLPEPNIPLTEVETNVVFSAGRPQSYEEMFRGHIMATNMTLSGSYRKTSEISESILKIQDNRESLFSRWQKLNF